MLFVDQRQKGSTLIIVVFVSLLFAISPTEGYDPLDPNGNITIKWDLIVGGSAPTVLVTITNLQQYRHIEQPGWRISWDWKNHEAIWDIRGAEATEQGNCSAFLSSSAPPPHCCLRHPVIVDLLPGSPYNLQVANCCRGGFISSMNQDSSKFASSFQMSIGSSDTEPYEFSVPENFTLGVPGYTCGNATSVEPTKFTEKNRRHKKQALATWHITCVYSQIQSSPAPKCCVSLSAFYNETVVPCQRCSCGCQGLSGARCVNKGEAPQLLQQHQDPTVEVPPVVQCTRHMCPIKVHWHVKVNYREYWRVKVTVTNFNVIKNYSEWNLVVLHPNLKSIQQVFSFNYKPLRQYGYLNDTAMFYGLPFYNDVLLQSGETGNVQSEILLKKDQGNFTFSEGWAFPRRILFNGDECVMPSPDDYPRLPNRAASADISLLPVFLSVLLLAFV
ncbi:PREDICTED: COBRA-like protein 6 [Tarenaya hassleriana]|uniref:COBRA-like protein 6 n=1 Tax=Tarenaya hassleriana TaxID=28532 RepID=UPI00053CA7AE|nr:PREDICTED: COBRA-like protein 6 [Tarenaya hassleriana]